MIKQPKFSIIKKQDQFELRLYQSFTMIEATDRDLQSNQGFRLAFNFIQGNNQSRQKIAMTAPVVNDIMNNEVQTTAFVIPPHMLYDDVPLPLNKELKKILVPERICAIYRFNMNPKMEELQMYEQILKIWIEKENYTIIGPLQLARYNPPFIPGFLKRNELWFEVIQILNNVD